MTVPHVPTWIEGAPDVLKAGMLLVLKDGSYHLCGSDDEGTYDAYFSYNTIRHTQLLTDYELKLLTEKGLTCR